MCQVVQYQEEQRSRGEWGRQTQVHLHSDHQHQHQQKRARRVEEGQQDQGKQEGQDEEAASLCAEAEAGVLAADHKVEGKVDVGSLPMEIQRIKKELQVRVKSHPHFVYIHSCV